ncbi:MAG: hypothetical protein ACI4VP_04370 [Clostridia bacterium]
MGKEKLIAKLNIKDYNKELENILQKKTFSKTVKNLLLSMLYKIENSYEDYKKVKVEGPSKREFIEELLRIIEQDCQNIEIVKPSLEETENILGEDKKSIAVKKEKKIITYQNELDVLEAIYKLNSKRFNIEPTDEISNKALSCALDIGEENFKSQVIRNFDGWSWNTENDEYKNNTQCLIYEALAYLIGYQNLNSNKNLNIEELENLLKEKYNSALSEKIVKIAKQVSILEYIKQDTNEKQLLIETRENLKEKLDLMEDKKKYIEDITNKKKKCIKEIEKIDKYINDDIALKKEYIKQNEALPQEERVFSLSDFSERIQEKRKNLGIEIETLTEKLKPKNYVKVKTDLEKRYDFINELNIEEPNISKFIDDFVKLILKALNEQIDKMTQKGELIEEIYKLRYLSLFNIDEKLMLSDKCKKQIEKLEKKLITIACNLKILTIFSKDTEENYIVYKNIFKTRIIDLDSVYIEINKDGQIKVYDENSLEKQEKYDEFKDLAVKYNKKIKIFL